MDVEQANGRDRGFFTSDRRQVFLVILAFWVVFGLYDASQTYFVMLGKGMHHAWIRIAAYSILTDIIWAILTPLIMLVSDLVPLSRKGFIRSLGVQAMAGCACSAVYVLTSVVLNRTLDPFYPIRNTLSFSTQLIDSAKYVFPTGLLIYSAVLATCYAFDFRSKFVERQNRAAHLETLLLRSQLGALRTQLRPHFLFNTLNGISALINDRDAETANRMLIALSGLLRKALESDAQQEIALSEDLEFLRLYVAIEEVRFGERLKVTIKADPDTLEARVPSLFLQPLVENAIRHGLGPRSAPGAIHVAALRMEQSLEFTVTDDGVGLPEDWSLDGNHGMGLSITRDRLNILYRDDHCLMVKNREGGGVEVRIQIPYRAVGDTN